MVEPAASPGPGPGLLESLSRFRLVSLILILGSLAIGAAVGTASPGQASATATLGLTDPRGSDLFRPSNISALSSGRYAASRAQFAQSQAVLETAAAKLGSEYTAQRLDRLVSAAAGADSDVIKISASGDNADEAARVANGVGAAYQNLTAKQTEHDAQVATQAIDAISAKVLAALKPAPPDRLQAQAMTIAASTTLSTLTLRVADIETASKLFGSGVQFIKPASSSNTSKSNRLLRSLAIALLLGLLLATAVAWSLAGRRPKVTLSERVVSKSQPGV